MTQTLGVPRAAGGIRSPPEARLELLPLAQLQGCRGRASRRRPYQGSRSEACVEAPPGQGCKALGLTRRQARARCSGQVRRPSGGGSPAGRQAGVTRDTSG